MFASPLPRTTSCSHRPPAFDARVTHLARHINITRQSAASATQPTRLPYKGFTRGFGRSDHTIENAQMFLVTKALLQQRSESTTLVAYLLNFQRDTEERNKVVECEPQQKTSTSPPTFPLEVQADSERTLLKVSTFVPIRSEFCSSPASSPRSSCPLLPCLCLSYHGFLTGRTPTSVH